MAAQTSSGVQIPDLPQGVGLNPQTLVTTINDRLRRITLALNAEDAAVAAAASAVMYGTHANRVGRPVASDGAVYVETDQGNLIYQVESTVWKYIAGVWRRTQSQLAALAATLGANDTGLLAEVTDYAHVLQWTGTAWQYNDPADPAGRGPVAWEIDPGTGWHLYDGSIVSYLESTGALGTIGLANISGASPTPVLLEFGAANAAPAAGTTGAVAGISTLVRRAFFRQ